MGSSPVEIRINATLDAHAGPRECEHQALWWELTETIRRLTDRPYYAELSIIDSQADDGKPAWTMAHWRAGRDCPEEHGHSQSDAPPDESPVHLGVAVEVYIDSAGTVPAPIAALDSRALHLLAKYSSVDGELHSRISRTADPVAPTMFSADAHDVSIGTSDVIVKIKPIILSAEDFDDEQDTDNVD